MLPLDSCIVLASVVLVITAQEWTKLNCPAPRSPTNGMSFIFDDGERVQFVCHPGFKMIGRDLAECKQNRWTGLPPRCIPVNANQDSSASTNDLTSPSSRSVFNWQKGHTEETDEPLSVAYGPGSNRVPLINGLWGYPSHRDSRVLSIVPDPRYGTSVNAKELVEQEMNIAAVRHQQEQEVKSSRHIEPKKEPTLSPYYSPYKINVDGYLVGVGGVDSHPVYYLGASADHKVDEYYKNTRIGPELAELRRKQIEEARNFQMNAANNRQRSRFHNTLTYGTKDIPVWKGRHTAGRYLSEETVYKPARVEMSKYSEQNRFFIHNPSNAPLIPKPKQNELRTKESPLDPRTENARKSSTRNDAQLRNIVTQTPRDVKFTRVHQTSFTKEMTVANKPTPPVLVSNPIVRIEPKKTEIPSVKNETVSAIKNHTSSVNASNGRTNRDDFEWPPEALWFKYPTTPKSNVVTIRPLSRLSTRRSSRGHKTRGVRVNKKKNQKHKEKRPQVTHFSHGRVKSTDPEGNRRYKS